MAFNHETVMLNEAVKGLAIDPEGIYIDATFGGGGHSRLILDHLNGGRLIAFDQDETAIKNGLEQFEDDLASNKLTLIHDNFAKLRDYMMSFDIDGIDGIIYDLGVSSPQFDQGDRGFSYRYDAKLDMRMNQNQSLSAFDIVNEWPYEELVRIIYRYGEERFAKQIARHIERRRESQPVATTFELVDIIKEAIPAAARRKGGHPAKRTFQALRIAVNDELNVFEESLEQAIRLLNIGGRISVITFHSLEDRLCKQLFREYSRPKDIPSGLPLLPEQIEEPPLKLINKKSIKPSEAEIENNRRSRSAQLRVAEKKNKIDDV